MSFTLLSLNVSRMRLMNVLAVLTFFLVVYCTLILTVRHSVVLRALQVIVSCTCTFLDASTQPLRGISVPAAGPSFPTLTPYVPSFAPSLPGTSPPPATDSGMHTDRFAFHLLSFM